MCHPTFCQTGRAPRPELDRARRHFFPRPRRPGRLGRSSAAQDRERPRTALRLSVEAFQEAPNLADNLKGQHRLHAACFAALVAAGKGRDAVRLPEEARAGLRLLAFAWLRADLDACRGLLDKEPTTQPFVRQRLAFVLRDADLASVRDPAPLSRLPEAERAAWARLWANVRALHHRGEAGR